MAKKFIQKALSRPGSHGALHRALGVPQGKRIPLAEIEKASHAPGRLGREARFAQTLASFNKK
jgi:hypothetical protein